MPARIAGTDRFSSTESDHELYRVHMRVRRNKSECNILKQIKRIHTLTSTISQLYETIQKVNLSIKSLLLTLISKKSNKPNVLLLIYNPLQIFPFCQKHHLCPKINKFSENKRRVDILIRSLLL